MASPADCYRAPERRAVFLDRDGTINVEKDYLHRVEDFEFLPGAPQAIRRLKAAGFLVIIVTNQSGVGRGYFSEQAVEQLHQHIQRQLSAMGTAIDAFYFCPHHPAAKNPEYRKRCGCRKGEPGMLLQAAEDHDIDLGSSWMIGDKRADIEAGRWAGCRTILVRTGYGRSAEDSIGPDGDRVLVADDLQAAAALILRSAQ